MTRQVWIQFAPLVIALPIIALVMMRNMKGRRLRVETMWIRPVIFLVLGAVILSQTARPDPLFVAIMVGALAVGAGLGWLRGRMMRIIVDPETHLATMQASPVATAFILGLVVVRFGARSILSQSAPSLHLDVAEVTDALLLLAIGLVVAQQLEMWLRCRRLIADSKAAKAARP